MTVGEVLASFGEHLRALIPFVIVSEWEQGVRTRFGRITKTCTADNGWFHTGLHSYWPIIGGVIVEDTNLTMLQTTEQTLTTHDGEAVVVSMIIAYRITDVGKYYHAIHDMHETIENAVESSIGRWMHDLNWEEVDEDAEEVPCYDLAARLVKEVEQDIALRLEPWGIEVDDFAVHTLIRVRALRLIM